MLWIILCRCTALSTHYIWEKRFFFGFSESQPSRIPKAAAGGGSDGRWTVGLPPSLGRKNSWGLSKGIPLALTSCGNSAASSAKQPQTGHKTFLLLEVVSNDQWRLSQPIGVTQGWTHCFQSRVLPAPYPSPAVVPGEEQHKPFPPSLMWFATSNL